MSSLAGSRESDNSEHEEQDKKKRRRRRKIAKLMGVRRGTRLVSLT